MAGASRPPILWVAGRQVARAVFGDMGVGIGPYPYALIFPQDKHERLLIDCLANAGVHVSNRLRRGLSRQRTWQHANKQSDIQSRFRGSNGELHVGLYARDFSGTAAG
jgi:hypothetical protein